jgi:hypothetical protein
MIFQDEQLAKEHNPELRLVTNNIEKVYSPANSGLKDGILLDLYDKYVKKN